LRETSNSVLNRCKTSNEQHHKRHSAIAALIKEIHEKSKMNAPATKLEDIAAAIHGYSEASIQGNRQALDKALAKDHGLGERISQNRGKTLNEDLKNEDIRQILSRLGFDKSVSLESYEQKELLLRLVDAIINDIETVANESREIYKRQLGFYHYADKRAYNALFGSMSTFNLESEEEEESEEPAAEDDSHEEGGQRADPTIDDFVPGPKPEGKENNDVKKFKTSSQQKGEMKLIFVSNKPKTTAVPKAEPLRERNVWHNGSLNVK
jgi:hypothetical protein